MEKMFSLILMLFSTHTKPPPVTTIQAPSWCQGRKEELSEEISCE
jgi:hypothetical protein